jgi:uncharacterized iron-regulated membrane protein
VFVFLFRLITGFFSWWLRNTKNLKQRFTFNWRSTTKWKRKNFDLHAILGFYALLFALIFALTGLTMAFSWFSEGVYQTIGGDKTAQFQIPENTSLSSSNKQGIPINKLPFKLKRHYPKAQSFEIHYPDTDSTALYVEISYNKDVFYNNDYRFYDQYTLEPIAAPSLYGAYQKADIPDKLIRMNYDIHVGAILGLPGKILAFLASLTIASLPVTGIMLWWGRNKKRTPYHSKPTVHSRTRKRKKHSSARKKAGINQ